MKTLFHVALILINSTLLFSQEDFAGEIKWGKPTPLKKNELGCQQIQVLNNKIYTASTTRKQDFTQVYDLTSLTFEEEKKLNLTYNNHKYTLLNTIVFGEQTLYISYYWDKTLKETTFILHSLLNENIQKPIQIATDKMDFPPYKELWCLNSFGKKGAFQYEISDNSQFLMILFKERNGSLLIKEDQTHTILFDNQGNELKRGVIDWYDLPTKTCKLDNNGNLYFSSLNGIEIYDGVKTEVVNINFPKFRLVWDFELLADGSLMVYGATRIKKTDGISGTFFIHIDSNNIEQYNVLENFEQGYLPLPKNDFEQGDYTLKIHDLVFIENGEMTLLLEQCSYYQETSAYFIEGGGSNRIVTDHYLYGHIIAVHFTQLGEVKWKQMIKKEQMTINDLGCYSSFCTFQKKNIMYLVYNDPDIYGQNKKIYIAKDNQVGYSKFSNTEQNSLVTITSIDETGKVSSQKLVEFKNASAQLIKPSYCKQITENEFILFMFNLYSKKKQIGRVVL